MSFRFTTPNFCALCGESRSAREVILPDSIHQQASDLFVATLHRFVADGGNLMLVYDAARSH